MRVLIYVLAVIFGGAAVSAIRLGRRLRREFRDHWSGRTWDEYYAE